LARHIAESSVAARHLTLNSPPPVINASTVL
jgi:hypothetical protein